MREQSFILQDVISLEPHLNFVAVLCTKSTKSYLQYLTSQFKFYHVLNTDVDPVYSTRSVKLLKKFKGSEEENEPDHYLQQAVKRS